MEKHENRLQVLEKVFVLMDWNALETAIIRQLCIVPPLGAKRCADMQCAVATIAEESFHAKLSSCCGSYVIDIVGSS